MDTTGSAVREQRRRIRQRLYNAILDFSLLVEYCRDTDREQVFNVSRRDSPEEFLEFDRSLASLIRFIYAGMDSEPWFESVLRSGVRNAEGVDLENVENPFFVNVGFHVEYATARGHMETAEHINNNEWDKVTAADLFAFIRVAKAASVTFDIDEIVEEIEEMKKREALGSNRKRDDEE
jgi:hypothetical protein